MRKLIALILIAWGGIWILDYLNIVSIVWIRSLLAPAFCMLLGLWAQARSKRLHPIAILLIFFGGYYLLEALNLIPYHLIYRIRWFFSQYWRLLPAIVLIFVGVILLFKDRNNHDQFVVNDDVRDDSKHDNHF